MDRQFRDFSCVLLAAVTALTGCAPTQPFYFMEDGDLSHYVDVATQIEYPDVEEPSLDEVTSAQAPLTVRNSENYEVWDLSLEEATRITLTNSQVMRQLGAVVQEQAPETISRNLINSAAVATTYDPALVESSTGTAFGSQFNGTGVEAALSAFDAQLDSSVSWQKNDRPVNVGGFATGFQSRAFQQDAANFNMGVSKTSAVGTQFAFRNNTTYDANNNLIVQGAPAFSQWGTNFETFISQPLLQGAGAQYNRIAGPFGFEQFAANGVNPFDGVVLARIRTDQSLADFEGAARNLMRDVEQSYWTLYFTYRDLEARKIGRDSALQTWKTVAALARQGARGGSADREAQARAQYFQFKAQVEQGLSSLYSSENRLRYIMGLAHTDGRLIRPADEPTTAQVAFDWTSVHGEALGRRVEVRKQKWEIKRRELELIAARNHLLPRLDAFGTYRWLGGGDDLFGDDQGVDSPFSPGVGAFNVLTDGNFQEWEMGLRFSLPIGFRQQLSTVRHHQLLLARERALLQDLELEVSHQLGDSIRDLDLNYSLTETNFNRREAAQREVEAVETSYKANRVTLDLLLDAQRRRSDAETAYYRSLVDYNLAITDVHFRKGSLLDYNGVYLAEGPWPGKAYFDAMRRARQRDASVYLDYGYTRPNVISRGPHVQEMGSVGMPGDMYEGEVFEGTPTPAMAPSEGEILQPMPMDDSYGAAAPAGAAGQLFAAPGSESMIAGVATGYESTTNNAFPQRELPPLANRVQLASAQTAGGGSGVVRAYGDAGDTYERQADHTADRPAAAAAVGAGGQR
ncbi:Outer membrane efflux protein [Botrimarina colliarenosi]|uniref:Outer membrane efflux protein n=1 Tax=Botrimarina colliarenosi TaxID=2528001 RepID=A0A5C6AJQ6_9BACT|nr:TolC family protein [Botrimarina colliarenosi]TWT99261.1 Outer membrane efflux protein [Botrimarina colliarenosi]